MTWRHSLLCERGALCFSISKHYASRARSPNQKNTRCMRSRTRNHFIIAHMIVCFTHHPVSHICFCRDATCNPYTNVCVTNHCFIFLSELPRAYHKHCFFFGVGALLLETFNGMHEHRTRHGGVNCGVNAAHAFEQCGALKKPAL